MSIIVYYFCATHNIKKVKNRKKLAKLKFFPKKDAPEKCEIASVKVKFGLNYIKT